MMRHVLRPTVQFAATFAAAAALSRMADPARRPNDEAADEPIVEPDAVRPDELDDVLELLDDVRELAVEPAPSYHSFGPEPVAVARVSYQPDRAVPRPEVEEVRKPALYVLKAPDEESGTVVPEASLDQSEQPEPQPKPEPGRSELSRPATGGVHGSVTNVHGRGLRDMCVEIMSADKTVVASTKTTDGGRFVVDDVPPGAYFLRAYDDVDGDFEKSWFGGRKFHSAESLTVAAGRPVDGIDIVLRSTARIDVEATAGERKTEVTVRVTHRATGAPATGEVELTTKNSDHIVATLVDGQAYMAFTDGDMAPVTKVRVYYSGDQQTRPASTKAKVN